MLRKHWNTVRYQGNVGMMEDQKHLKYLSDLPIDSKKKILIFAKDCPKNAQKYSKLTFLNKNKYQNLINNSNQFITTNNSADKRNLGGSIVDRKCISSKNKFKSIFKTTMISKNETPSKRKKGEPICVENEEAIKLLNLEIIKAKCTSILNKQIKQKMIKEKAIADENKNQLQKMSKDDEIYFQKSITKEKEEKERNRNKLVQSLETQTREKEVMNIRNKQENERERERVKILIEKERQKDLADIDRKREDKKRILKKQTEMISNNKKIKEKKREEENELSEKIKQEQEIIAEKEQYRKDLLNRKVKAKAEKLEVVNNQLEHEKKIQKEVEKFWEIRRENENDLKWMEKEKQETLKALEKRKQLFYDNVKQIEDKVKQKKKDITHELDVMKNIQSIMEEADAKIDREKQKRIEEIRKYKEHLRKQMEEKAKQKRIKEYEEDKIRNQLKDKEKNRQENVKKVMEKKINELRSLNIEENLVKYVKQKAKMLESKI